MTLQLRRPFRGTVFRDGNYDWPRIDVSRTNRSSPRAKQFIYAIIPTFLQGGVFESRYEPRLRAGIIYSFLLDSFCRTIHT